MAKSKSAKRNNAKQKSRQRRTEHHNTKAAEKEVHHLPKVGTPANDAYRLKRSREDVVDFGRFRTSKGPWPTILAILVSVLVGLAFIGWFLIT
jgi:hypothetical protein